MLQLKFEQSSFTIERCVQKMQTYYPSVESPWTQWTLSMDIVKLEYWNAGHWTMSTESMDNVHGINGQCPLSPWTLSTESMVKLESSEQISQHFMFKPCLMQIYLC